MVLPPTPERPAVPEPVTIQHVSLPETGFEQARLMRNNPEPRAFYDALYKALQQYLAERLQLNQADLNWPNIRQKLEKSQVTFTSMTALEQVWHACEQALFAGQAHAEHIETHWRQTQTFYSELERHFRG